ILCRKTLHPKFIYVWIHVHLLALAAPLLLIIRWKFPTSFLLFFFYLDPLSITAQVTFVAPDGAAAQAGMRTGHSVISIGSTPVTGLTVDEIHQLISRTVARYRCHLNFVIGDRSRTVSFCGHICKLRSCLLLDRLSIDLPNRPLLSESGLGNYSAVASLNCHRYQPRRRNPCAESAKELGRSIPKELRKYEYDPGRFGEVTLHIIDDPYPITTTSSETRPIATQDIGHLNYSDHALPLIRKQAYRAGLLADGYSSDRDSPTAPILLGGAGLPEHGLMSHGSSPSPQISYKPRHTPLRGAFHPSTDPYRQSSSLGAVARLAIDGGLSAEQLLNIGQVDTGAHTPSGSQTCTPVDVKPDMSSVHEGKRTIVYPSRVCRSPPRNTVSSHTQRFSRPTRQPVPHCWTYQPIHLSRASYMTEGVNRAQSRTHGRGQPFIATSRGQPNNPAGLYYCTSRRGSFPLQMTRVGGIVLDQTNRISTPDTLENAASSRIPLTSHVSYQSVSACTSPTSGKHTSASSSPSTTMAFFSSPINCVPSPMQTSPILVSSAPAGCEGIVRLGPGDTVTHASPGEHTYNATSVIRMHDCPQPYVSMAPPITSLPPTRIKTDGQNSPTAINDRSDKLGVEHSTILSRFNNPPITAGTSVLRHSSPVCFHFQLAPLQSLQAESGAHRTGFSPPGSQVARTVRHLRRIRHIFGDSLGYSSSGTSASTGALASSEVEAKYANSLIELRSHGSRSADSVRPMSCTCKCFPESLPSAPCDCIDNLRHVALQESPLFAASASSPVWVCFSRCEADGPHNWTSWERYRIRIFDNVLVMTHFSADQKCARELNTKCDPLAHVHIPLTEGSICWYGPNEYPDRPFTLPDRTSYGDSPSTLVIEDAVFGVLKDLQLRTQQFTQCLILLDRHSAMDLFGQWAPPEMDRTTRSQATSFDSPFWFNNACFTQSIHWRLVAGPHPLLNQSGRSQDDLLKAPSTEAPASSSESGRQSSSEVLNSTSLTNVVERSQQTSVDRPIHGNASSFIPLPLSASGPLMLQKCPRSTLSPFVPFVVELCVTLVERYGLNCVGLYRLSGSKVAHDFISTELRKTLPEIDVHSDKWNDIHAVCGVLKTFLRNLPDSLFPKVMYADFLAACRIPQREKRLLSIQRLLGIMECYPHHPEYRAHRATLRYLATHLARVCAREAVNKMTSYNLALVFAPNLVQPYEDSPELLMSDSKYKILLVEIVIKYHAWIFSPDLGLESGCSIPTDSVEDLTSACTSELELIGGRVPNDSALQIATTTSLDVDDTGHVPGRVEGDVQPLVAELLNAASDLPPPPSDMDLETAEEPGPSSDRPSDIAMPVHRPRFTSIPTSTWSAAALHAIDSGSQTESLKLRPELIFTQEVDLSDLSSERRDSDMSTEGGSLAVSASSSRLRPMTTHLGTKLDSLRHLSQGCLDQYATEARELGVRVAESRRQLECTTAQRLHAEQLLQEARSQNVELSEYIDCTAKSLSSLALPMSSQQQRPQCSADVSPVLPSSSSPSKESTNKDASQTTQR
ncbi:Rho GTPase-activating protein 21/23, partial [Paragonimus westermani]